MSRLSKARGNMYEWVTHVWNPLDGRCPHRCPYCYVQDMGERLPAVREHYTGKLRLDIPFPVLGDGKTIFVGHMNDLYAEEVPLSFIESICGFCCTFDNSYVFQTKNPARVFMNQRFLPGSVRIGTTAETNRPVLGRAPQVPERLRAIRCLRDAGEAAFVTIEPVMDFDVVPFAEMLIDANPCFVNIGADSKASALVEPPAEKIVELIRRLGTVGIEVRCKRNLGRITP